ncbi:MAG: signal peptidase I [Dehalococcoidales bacterium]|nr:signal peptidase I [Dehalococcoidales bacterium]
MKNVFSWALIIIIVAGAIYGIPLGLRAAMGVDSPMLTVISGSMWPQLSRGDVVIVKETSLAEIEKGTVIVFRHEGGLAVHRVVNINGNWITTKGDANSVEDDPIPYNDVVGRVPLLGEKLVKIPWVGNIALAMNPEASKLGEPPAPPANMGEALQRYVATPVGFVLIIVLPLLLLFGGLLVSLFARLLPHYNRRQRRQKLQQRLVKRWGEARARHALRL